MIISPLRVALLSSFAMYVAVAARAQTDATTAFGQGVHALNGGSAAQSERLLSTATALAPRDPRTYYFQSLALRRQGRFDEAEAVLQAGAMVEAQYGGAAYRVNQALERVQGAERLAIEKARREAREMYGQARVANMRARYAAREARQMAVQRTPGRLPLAAFANSVSLEQARVIAADNTDPFKDDDPPPAVAVTDSSSDDSSGGSSPFDDFAPTAGTASTTTATTGTPPAAVEIPDEARGSVKAGNLFSGVRGLFGRSVESVTNMVPPGVLPGGAGGPPGGFGEGDFGGGDFGGGEFGPGGGFGEAEFGGDFPMEEGDFGDGEGGFEELGGAEGDPFADEMEDQEQDAGGTDPMPTGAGDPFGDTPVMGDPFESEGDDENPFGP